MLDYQKFDSIFGFKFQSKTERYGRDVFVCPICGSPAVGIVNVEYEDGKHLAADFQCEHKHTFRLDIAKASGRLKGEWRVLVDNSVSFDDLPTRRQLEFAERISQRTGVPNPWSEARCLFPEQDGPEGMPLFTSCGVDKDCAGAWISRHVDAYHTQGKKTTAADVFAVWRLENSDSTLTIGISHINDGVPTGADIWVGSGFCERAATDDDLRTGLAIMGITELVPTFDSPELTPCKRTLFGSWHSFPFAKGVSKPLKAHRQYSYRRAKKTAQACALYERAQGRVLTNEIPDDLGRLQNGTLVLYNGISDSSLPSIADLSQDSRLGAGELESDLEANR